jgi:hypothetical protein
MGGGPLPPLDQLCRVAIPADCDDSPAPSVGLRARGRSRSWRGVR